MASAKPVKKTSAKRKKANGYQMPGHIPQGEVLRDTGKNEWVIETSIGIGGFGEIYSAYKSTDPKHNNYAVKIEPSENGPLFCERNIYIRIGKKDDIEEFMKLRKLKSLGMPQYYGFGSHDYGGTKYRFLVMERYGRDLWSLFLENGNIFPTSTVLKIGVQVVDVYEYIHHKGYIHGDVKGANLLLGIHKGSENQVFLVDFGLASRYSSTEFKPDPKKAHNGTIEYTSRDSHSGVSTRRGDIEIMGYNMLHWLSSSLPWEKLKDCPSVQAQKIKYMKDTNRLLKVCFDNREIPDQLKKYFDYTCKMEPLDQPDYDKLRKILSDGSRKASRTDNKLEFSTPKETSAGDSPRAKKIRKTDKSTEKISSRSTAAKENQKGTKINKELEKSKSPKNVAKRSWKDFPTIVNGARKIVLSEEIPAKVAKKKK